MPATCVPGATRDQSAGESERDRLPEAERAAKPISAGPTLPAQHGDHAQSEQRCLACLSPGSGAEVEP